MQTVLFIFKNINKLGKLNQIISCYINKIQGLMERQSQSPKKLLLMQQFISLLLIFKTYLHEVNLYLYYFVLLAFFVGKHIKEGNTIGTVGQVIATVFIIIGNLIDSQVFGILGVVTATLNYIFVAPTLYKLPQYSPKVGLRDNYLKRNDKILYWAQWYPIQQTETSPQQTYQIPWNHTVQLQKMADYANITKNDKILMSIFKFLNSSLQRYKLTFAKGKPSKHKAVMLFSHGRTGTPFVYSSILRCFARQYKILSPQHSQVNKTIYKDIKDIKKFREVEIKQRAQQIIFMASKVSEDQELILMGHSHGCATILQAYNMMPLSIRKRVSKIILLDPWLFPLTQEVLDDAIACPILMLANQYFVGIKDVYTRNKDFVKKQGSKLLYICWKKGNHLHQTDLPFILGTSGRRIKNVKEGSIQLKRNIQAIQMFLEFKNVGLNEIQQFQSKFNENNLGIDYNPSQWDETFTF